MATPEDFGIKIKVPNYTWKYSLTPRQNTKYIVIHHAAGYGSPEEIHRYHQDVNGWNGIAYNYYIRTDGTVYQGRPINAVGGHTLNYNSVSVGICFEGNYQNAMLSNESLTAGIGLISYLKTIYPAAMLCGHKELNSTACPGNNFPLDTFKDAWVNTYNEKTDEDQIKKSPPEWAQESIEYCVREGIFQGDGNGEYNWNNMITRAECAIVAKRIIDKLT